MGFFITLMASTNFCCNPKNIINVDESTAVEVINVHYGYRQFYRPAGSGAARDGTSLLHGYDFVLSSCVWSRCCFVFYLLFNRDIEFINVNAAVVHHIDLHGYDLPGAVAALW